MVDPVGEALEAGRLFTDVAMADPVSALLLALGNLLIVFSVAVLGYLSLGGAVTALTRLA